MAKRKNTQAEELYEVAVLLLAVVKVVKKTMKLSGWSVDTLIRRAKKATARRP